MKEKDLYVDFTPQQAIYYVEKDDASYGPVVSGSQLSHDYLDDFYVKKRNLDRRLRTQLAANEISPVYYYMMTQEMGLADLAARAGVRKRRLKHHLKPAGFAALSVRQLLRYANVFDVALADFFRCNEVKEENSAQIVMDRFATNNPVYDIVRLKIKEGTKHE